MAKLKFVHYINQFFANIGGEEKKGGVAPAEVIDFAKEVDKYPSVRLKGLMSVLPNVEKEAQIHNCCL